MSTPLSQDNSNQDPVKRPSRFTILFLMTTLFLNVVGMTIVFPVLPFIVRQYLSDPNALAPVIGWLSASYAICQFFAAPALGALSDRFGRRPILFICMFGTVLGFLLFGIGGALWVLFLGRIIDGLTGGDSSVLFAYIGDISDPEERGKLFGRIGGLFGIGFIVGPAIGGFTAKFGYSVPFYLAAVIIFATMLWGLFVMPESLKPENRTKQIKLADLNPLAQIGNIFAVGRLRWLIVTRIFHSFPFAMFNTVLTILLIEKLQWTPDSIGIMLLVVGCIDIVMQGVLAERLIARWGEARLTMVGLFGLALSFIVVGLVSIVPNAALLYIGIAVFSVASGVLEPSLNALTSKAANADEQGTVQGSSTALIAAANVAAPLIAGALYIRLGGQAPYWLGAVILLLGIITMRLASKYINVQSPMANAESVVG